MEALPEPDTHTVLPKGVHTQLWDRIATRLERGDALITTRDFRDAVEAEYEALTGTEVTPGLRDLFRQAISAFNRDYPERYVALGVQNGVTRAFQTGVFQLAWDTMKIESLGHLSIARFKSRDRVLGLLREVRVPPRLIDGKRCIQHALDVVSGRKKPLVKRPAREPLEPRAAQPEPPPPPPVSEEATQAVADGNISQFEADSRARDEEETHAQIEQQQLRGAARHVTSFVDQGFVTVQEGETVRELGDIDQRVASGEIDERKGARLRDGLLSPEASEQLESKLKGAVDHAVCFLHVFEAIGRIPDSLDDALRFLIRHKGILKEAGRAQAMAAAGQELMTDSELLTRVSAIMDRQDQEIRMISVSLPPYGQVARRENDRIGNLTVEEDFIGELREVGSEEMSDRLNSADAAVRVRPAADMLCLLAIINHLIKPTPWRKEVRLLRIQDALEQFYRDTDDLEEARRQAESFLKRRLRRMFSDLTADEKALIDERGSTMISTVEQKVLAERRAAEGAQGAASEGRNGSREKEDTLSEEEIGMGAQIGRVELRVAGRMRPVPRKIIVDPDDPSVNVIAQRHPDTGELEPTLRRGAKRVVEKGRDGIWRPRA